MSSRNVRSMAGLSVGVIAVGGVLLGVWAAQGAQGAQAAVGTDPGGVALSPASGSINSTPTWSTNTACPAAYQGSAVFRAVKPDGTIFSISQATNSVKTPFHGTLQAPISFIKNTVARVANGASQELVVICFSGDSLTGTSKPDMDTFITYSANGASYTTSSVAPTSSATSPSTSSSAGGTGSSTHPSSSASGSSSSSSGSSSSHATPSESTTVVPDSPTSSASPAASPSAVDSSFAVTG